MTSPSSAQPEPTMEEILASIRRIISEDSEPGAKPAAGPQPQAATRQTEPDVLELTQVAAEDPPARPEPVRAAPERPRVVKPEPAPRSAPQPVRNESDLQMVDKDDRDGLVSNQAHSAISQAFGMLSRDRGDRDLPVSAGEARTLEDIVAGMMRPMLQQWLEENLPEMVERVVREEVERASRGQGRRR